MSSPFDATGYTGAPTLEYNHLSDDEPNSAATFNTPLEGHAIDLGRVGNGYRVAKSFTRFYTDFRWDNDTFPGALRVQHWSKYTDALQTVFQCSVAANQDGDIYLWLRADLPHGAVLTRVDVPVLPAGGHAGLPATMPLVELFGQDMLTGGLSTLVTQGDTSANTAAYHLAHSISATGLSHTIDRDTYVYHFRIRGELSTNSLVGLKVFGARCYLDTDIIDHGAG